LVLVLVVGRLGAGGGPEKEAEKKYKLKRECG
jgi:hypothetical protein